MNEDNSSKSTNGSAYQNRRQFLRYTGGAAAVPTVLAGCLGDDDDEGGSGGSGGSDGGGQTTDDGDELADEISFMTWGGSFLDSMESNYAEPFEEEYGVEVNVVGASSGHEMFARIRAGAQDVHIINPEEVPAYGPIQEGLIHPIRKENISNYDKIQDAWNPDDAVYDPGEEIHHIPHVYGGTGLVYNHDEMDEPSSWMDVMTEDLMGDHVYYNYPNYVVGQAAIALGMDIGEAVEDESMMEEIWDLVEERNEYVYQWSDSGSTTMELFSTGSATAGALWIGRTAAIQDDGVPVTYTVPEEGAYAWLNTLNIPSYVEDPHRRTAELFLDYMLEEEPTAGFVEEQVYAPPIEYTETEPPAIIAENPDVEHVDRLQSMDPEIYNENVDDWEQRFQEIVRS